MPKVYHNYFRNKRERITIVKKDHGNLENKQLMMVH